MNLTILIRKSLKRDFVEAVVLFYAKTLKLSGNAELVVVPEYVTLRKAGHRGRTMKDNKTGMIILSFNHRLTTNQLLITLAHEMVHVKQLATGRLRTAVKDRKTIRLWCGKDYTKTPYMERPWEIQAYKMQEVLVQELVEKCGL